jgi:hypothetical protein
MAQLNGYTKGGVTRQKTTVLRPFCLVVRRVSDLVFLMWNWTSSSGKAVMFDSYANAPLYSPLAYSFGDYWFG